MVIGLARTASPTADGMATIEVMRMAFPTWRLAPVSSLLAYAAEIPGMIAELTAVAMEIGMLEITTALLEKIPYRVVVAVSPAPFQSISIRI